MTPTWRSRWKPAAARRPPVHGATGPDGAFRFSIPVPSSSSDDSTVLRATVTDVSGQSYTRCEDILCRADAFQVYAAPSERSIKAGATVQIEVHATPGPASR